MSLHHSWNLTPGEAIALQKKLVRKIIKRGVPKNVKLIAGCDIAYDKKSNRCFAGVLVFCWPGLERVEEVFSSLQIRFPYVPGLLTFREAPALLDAIGKLKLEPDLFMIDGQGIAHPRRIGLASHLGLLLDKPTIGVAKSRLTGQYEEPELKRGSRSDLRDGKEMIGAVLRTRDRVRPLFISIGHKIGLQSAIDWVLKTSRGYRIPEPTRQADIFVEHVKKTYAD